MAYLQYLKEFQAAVYNKTKDPRHQLGQEFRSGSLTAVNRAQLCSEENLELNFELLTGRSKADMLKEICDCLYVLFGTAAIYNLDVDAAFKLVHENNMEKIAKGTIAEGGKLVKPENHPKVDLSALL